MLNLLWIVLFVFVFAAISKMQERIASLEERLRQGGAVPAPTPQPAVTSTELDAAPMPSMPAFTPPAIPVATSVPAGPTAGEQLFAWLKEDWLLKLGALLLLMGLGWFIAYAFTNNWIGPMGRIGLGILLGALAMLLGAVRMGRYKHQGEVFLVAGGTTILLTLFSARSVYDFFTPASVLLCMFLTAMVVAAVSVYRDSNALALSSILMALAAPLFVASTAPDYLGLFSYLVAVILGTMWIVALRKQRSLILIALAGVWWYSIAALLDLRNIPETVQTPLAVVIGLIALVFFVASVVNQAQSESAGSEDDALDVIIAIGTGLLVWTWTNNLLPPEAHAGALFLWAVVFMTGALYAYLLNNRPEPVYTFGGVGAMLLGIATSIQFDGHTLTIAWTLEAAVLAIGTLLLTKRAATASRMAIVYLAPVMHSFAHFNVSSPPRYDDAFALATLALAMLVTGGLMGYYRSEEESRENLASEVLVVLGVLYAFMAAPTIWSEGQLTNVWTVGAVITVLLTYAITHRHALASAAALTFLFPAIRSIEHIGASSWSGGVVHIDALALLLLGTGLLACGFLLRKESLDSREDEARISVVIMTLGSLYYYILLWLAAPTFFGPVYAVMAALVIYTLIGLAFYLPGRTKGAVEASVYGACMLGFVVLRLLLVDVWQMELSGRIITFLLIGTLLTTTAFIGRAPKST
jgi:uncharacterized membrane protein